MPEPKNTSPFPKRDAWVVWFLLGVVMLNYPFLHIFNKLTLVFGVPLLVLYFLVGWPISIFVIYLFSRCANGSSLTVDRDQNMKTGKK
jgi:hypothetical protein